MTGVVVLIGADFTLHGRVILQLYKDGAQLVICDYSAESPLLACAHHHICVDLSRQEEAFQCICATLERLRLEVAFFLGLSERAVELCARLLAHYRLPGLPLAKARLGRDKFAMKEFLHQHGVELAPYHLCHNADDLAAFMTADRGPLVLKPVNSGASDGVIKIESRNELAAHVAFVHDALAQSTGDVDRECFLAEEYLPGREVSVETLSDRNGGHHLLAVTEKLLDDEPFFNEVGYLVAAELDQSEKTALYDYCQQVLSALKLSSVVCHLQVRFAPTPRLVEIDLCPGSGKIIDLINLSYQVDPYRLLIRMLAGDELPPFPAQPAFTSMLQFFYVFEPQRLGDFCQLCRQIDAVEGVQEYRLRRGHFAQGDNPKHWANRAGYVIFRAPSRQECFEQAAQVQHVLQDRGIYLGQRSPYNPLGE